MNKIILTGNLGKEPEMNYTPSGTAITKFSLAVRGYGKDAETEWFNIVAWKQLAETCSTYLKKGSKVLIEGRLSQRKYTDKNGVERTMIEVIANEMEMLDSKKKEIQSDTFEPLSGSPDDHPF